MCHQNPSASSPLTLKFGSLKDPQMNNHFQEVFNSHVNAFAGLADAATEDIWNIKTGLLKRCVFSLPATSLSRPVAVFTAHVCKEHASETWPLTKPNIQRLQQNDRAMISRSAL